MGPKGAFIIAILVCAVNAHSLYSSSEESVGPVVARGFFDNIVNKVKDTAQGVVNNAKDQVTGVVDKAKDQVNSVVDKAQEAAQKVKEETEKAVKEATSLVDTLKNLNVCTCEGTSCQCCAELKLTKNKLCFSLAFKPETFEVEYSLVLNEKALVKGEVKGANPGVLCAPLFPPAVSGCFRPYDLSFSTKDGFNICMQVEVKVLTKTLATVGLNCFRFTRNSIAMLPATKPIEGGLVNLDVSKITNSILKDPVIKFPW